MIILLQVTIEHVRDVFSGHGVHYRVKCTDIQTDTYRHIQCLLIKTDTYTDIYAYKTTLRSGFSVANQIKFDLQLTDFRLN